MYRLHRHHVQGDILKILMQIIHNSPASVHLFKVQSLAGIASNEYAVSSNPSQCKSCKYRDAMRWFDGNPFHNMSWNAFGRDISSDATSSRPSNLHAPKLIHFLNLYDALKAHMHSKHKVGHANPTIVCFIIKVNFL